MPTELIWDIVGYVGMGFVLISFLLKDIKWVRRINIIGALISAIYGFATKTYPTLILNAALTIINLFYLQRGAYVSWRKNKKAKEVANQPSEDTIIEEKPNNDDGVEK